MKLVLVALGIVFALAIGIFGGYVLRSQQAVASAATPSPTPALHDVLLRIPALDQCTSFSASYNVYGGRAQNNYRICGDQDTIFEYKAPSGEGITFFAQDISGPGNQNRFQCLIEIDGALVAKADAHGEGAIATCNAIVP
jgi:hypothetical protein